MQPSFDNWDFEPPQDEGGQWNSDMPPMGHLQVGGSEPSFNASTTLSDGGFDPNEAAAFGLVDISKGRTKGGGKATTDNWDSWNTPNGGKGDFPPQPPVPSNSKGPSPKFGKGGGAFNVVRPKFGFGQPADEYGGKNNFDSGCKGNFGSSTGPGNFDDADLDSRLDNFGNCGSKGDFGKGSTAFGKSSFDFGKGSKGNFNNFKGGAGFNCGKGKSGFDSGKGNFDGGKFDFATEPSNFGEDVDAPDGGINGKGSVPTFGKSDAGFGCKGGVSSKAAIVPCKSDAFGTKGVPKKGGKFGSTGMDFTAGKGSAPGKMDFSGKIDLPSTKPGNFPPAPPGTLFASGKSGSFNQPCRGVQPLGSNIRADGPNRGPGLLVPAPRMASFSGKGSLGKGLAQRGSMPVLDARTAASSLGSALAAVAGAAGRGPNFRGTMPLGSTPQSLAPHGALRGPPPPPPGAPAPSALLGQGMLANLAKGLPALTNFASTNVAGLTTTSTGLAPELAALVSAGEVEEGSLDGKVGAGALPIDEKKPRIFLLITRLAPDLEENHVQQILEQCGEVQAWRRGRDSNGIPLSFGFAQFGDPEAAWKASTCLSKRMLHGQEIKVLIEENAEAIIQQWRTSQQSALKVSTDEELEWELERKAVTCKALINAKIEELYGPSEDSGDVTGGAAAQRHQELREKEQARIERTRKRKAWRDTEFAKELANIEGREKRLRRTEQENDDADRIKEENEAKEKEEQELKLAKMEDVGTNPVTAPTSHAENRVLCEMVDRVQTETRDDLFKMDIDINFFRGEKTFEKKLRPWLERKIDLFMGGPQSDLVEYILRRVNASSMPDALISDLTRYLDDNAEPLIERMWRMLAFELMCNGPPSANIFKKEKQEEVSFGPKN